MSEREERVLRLIEEARAAGAEAAQKKLAELQGKGPAFAVVENAPGDLFSNPSQPARVVGVLLDVCGFANLKIKARGWFYLGAKKLQEGRRFSCGKSYLGGGRLSIFDMSQRQELSVNEAAYEAAAQVLRKNGLEAYVESRVD